MRGRGYANLSRPRHAAENINPMEAAPGSVAELQPLGSTSKQLVK